MQTEKQQQGFAALKIAEDAMKKARKARRYRSLQKVQGNT